jgi:hypothetical protein
MNRTLLTSVLLGIALVGCRKDEENKSNSLPVDLDGDGFAATVDCDDDNAAVYPNAEELCDGLDNDCDSAVDEGVGSTFYADADGDGFGDSAAEVLACEETAGIVADNTDCDDGNANRYPGAPEVCDEVDNNCNDVVDEDALTTYFRDVDGDGFGTTENSVEACEAPTGFVTDDTDCDDADAANFPGNDEVCDGQDNDCDGGVDNDAVDFGAFWVDQDGDGFGDAEAESVAACEAPSGSVDNNSDCDDTNDAIHPDADEICDEVDNNCDAVVDDVDTDGDSYFDRACLGGDDCDDDNAAVNPGETDSWYDGVDTDCDGGDDYDADADGYVPDAYVGLSTLYVEGSGALPGGDCKDSDAAYNPGETETWYDGIDIDCALDDDYDADADGYIPSAYAGVPTTDVPGSGALPIGDCNDTAASINPGATEAWYDGTDQDCGEDDDYDADADGYVPDGYAGYPTVGVTGTGALPDGDCDDEDASINPVATDTWYDGVDQDCDGADDYDKDGDGYASSDYTGGDCDDDDTSINPGAAEVCDDGIDQNCDGTSDTCSFLNDVPVTDADVWFYGEGASDRVGQGDPGVTNGGDLDGDGVDDLLVSAIFDDDAGTNAGVVHVFYGPVSGAGVGVTTSDAQISGASTGDLFGRSVVPLGDVDNDGYDDALISAQGDATNGSNTGAAYLVCGPLGTAASSISTLATTKFIGAAAGDLIADVAPAGDVNNDGHADLLISAQFLDAGGTVDGGGAYLIYGPTTTSSYDLGSPLARDARFIGEEDDDQAGSPLWGGEDLNGDGLFDIIVAARYYDDGTNADSGAVYVVHGPVSGDVDLSTADARYSGEGAADELGYGASVGNAGDVNNDGYEDLIVGARFNDRGGAKAGSAYVILGPISTGTLDDVSNADAIFVGEVGADQTGDSVSGAGDVDGDGNADLLIGSGWYDSTSASNGGAGYLILGPVTAGTGVVDLSSADARFLPEGANDRVRINSAGDIDADGYSDILIATQNNSTNSSTAGSQHGAVYLFYGKGI